VGNHSDSSQTALKLSLDIHVDADHGETEDGYETLLSIMHHL
jgi:hypothetical protein